MVKFFVTISLILLSSQTFSQKKVKITISDSVTNNPIASVTLTVKNKQITFTDSTGFALITTSDSIISISASAIGYKQQLITIHANEADLFRIFLVQEQKDLEEVTVVSSTRSNQSIESAPIKIEVLDNEEMKEESTVKPGTVLGIIGDISGIQIQQLSATSGNSDVRIQGLEGKYTQILRDGLPLYDGFSGGFGLMSIPPLDLKQVELIKGSASTLYGGGAIGGLVNLISKRPTTNQESIITFNQTTLKESNFNSFFSKRNKKAGYTFYAGITNQSAVDVNDDGFSDVSRMQTLVVHPRLFFYPDEKTTIIAGFCTTNDKRNGGDMIVLEDKPDSIHQYFENNKILRNSAELILERKINAKDHFTLKTSASNFMRDVSTQTYTYKAKQFDYFSEASFLINRNKHNWVTGINFSGNNFNKISGDSTYINDVANKTIGSFLQYNYKATESTNFELGLRDDYHFTYGNFILPRIALFHRINDKWGMRAGFGAGYKIPNALSPQINDYPLTMLLPIDNSVKPERSYGYNAELNYKLKWDEENSLFINQAFFLTQLNNPMIAAELSNGQVAFSNASKPIITKGFDTYMKLRLEEWELYAGCTYTIAERKYLSQNQFMPLTPKFRLAGMLTKEWEGKARFCVESSYNGYQYRLDNSKTPGYLFMAAMFEYKFGMYISAVINCENILDYRQSKIENLYTGNISNPNFVPLWAPIDGRVININLKYSLR